MKRLFLLLLLTVGCNLPMPMRCHGHQELLVNINPPENNGFNLQWYCPPDYHLVTLPSGAVMVVFEPAPDPISSKDPHYTEWTLVCECNQ